MAKKKKMGWDFDDETAKEEAKTSIQKTTKAESKSKPKPKKKMGRPKVITEKTANVKIHNDARLIAKKLAVLKDESLTNFISQLIYDEGLKQGIK